MALESRPGPVHFVLMNATGKVDDTLGDTRVTLCHAPVMSYAGCYRASS